VDTRDSTSHRSLTPLIAFVYILGLLLFGRFLPVTDSYSILEIAKYDENVEQLVFFCPGVFLHLVNVAADVYCGCAFLQSEFV